MEERLQDKICVRADEAASILGIGKTLFYKLKSQGKLPPSYNLGGAVVWRVSELTAWAEAGFPCREKWEKIKNA